MRGERRWIAVAVPRPPVAALMPETPSELFTNVPVDLFRMGNASGPRLDNVRPQDVDFVDETLPGAAR